MFEIILENISDKYYFVIKLILSIQMKKTLSLFVFIFSLAILALDIIVLIIPKIMASIAFFQMSGNDFSIVKVICIDMFAICICLSIYIATLFSKNSNVITGIYIVFMFFFIVKETIMFKFITCYNYPTNSIIIARSFLVFIMVLFSTMLSVRYLQSKSSPNFRILYFILIFILGSLMLAIFILNIVLLSMLNNPLANKIGPENIKIGYFNQTDINLILNGKYVKDNTYNNRIIGTLSNVIYSNYSYQQLLSTFGNVIYSNYSYYKDFSYVSCSSKSSCTYNNLNFYNFQIACTSQNQAIYQDCLNASSLTMKLKYLDFGPYPSYNCIVNTDTENCSKLCSQFLYLNYQLILIQDFSGIVQPAWQGLSNCNKQPRIYLNQDFNIAACSFASNLNENLILYSVLVFISLLYLI